MKKKTFRVLLSATIAFIVLSGCEFDKSAYQPAASADNISFEYPVGPGKPGWEDLSPDEANKLLQIPEQILQIQNTEALIDSCLNYPYLINIYAKNTLQEGIDELRKTFNGFRALLERADAASKLIEKYNELDISRVEEKNPEEEDAVLKCSFIELLLSQEFLIKRMTDADKKYLVTESLAKYHEMSRYPEVFGYLNLAPCGAIMKRVMESDMKRGIESEVTYSLSVKGIPDVSVSYAGVDRENIDAIIELAKKYIGE